MCRPQKSCRSLNAPQPSLALMARVAKLPIPAGVAGVVDGFLKPPPAWPPQVLAGCPAARLQHIVVTGEDPYEAEIIVYPDHHGVSQALRIDWGSPYFSGWQAWHGRRWPQRGLFVLSAEELRRELRRLDGELRAWWIDQRRPPGREALESEMRAVSARLWTVSRGQ